MSVAEMVAKPKMSSPRRLEELLMMKKVATEVVLGLADEVLLASHCRVELTPDSTLAPPKPFERSFTICSNSTRASKSSCDVYISQFVTQNEEGSNDFDLQESWSARVLISTNIYQIAGLT